MVQRQYGCSLIPVQTLALGQSGGGPGQSSLRPSNSFKGVASAMANIPVTTIMTIATGFILATYISVAPRFDGSNSVPILAVI